MGKAEHGKVRWFNGTKGYGFIERASGEDVFVHYSGIIGDGYRNLLTDQMVEYEVIPTARGEQAINVRVIG